jgi:hypothetical protein
MSLSVEVYDKAIIVQTYSNETLASIRSGVIAQLGL